MAAVSCVMSEDQFLCSICLEVFTDPVTTPCGHSFCKICINKHWDNSSPCHCPVCKEDFITRPLLKISTCLSEMVAQFKKKHQNENLVLSEVQAVGPADASCDVCSEVTRKALKSCLVCLVSYCQNHLEPHLTIPRLMRHQLIEPVKNLEDRICTEHDKSLELFCREDLKFICLQCTSLDHKDHEAVPLKEEGEEEQANVKQMIEKRQYKIEEIQRSIEISKKTSESEIEKGVNIYNNLINCVQDSLDILKDGIEIKHMKAEEQALEWIRQLETEIKELKERTAEMEQIWSSEDHLHFLQTFKSAKPAPLVQDWTKVKVRAPSYGGTVAKAVAELRDMELHLEIRRVLRDECKRLQQFKVEVTLDPETAHRYLSLYSDKQVYFNDRKKDFPPDSSKRFSNTAFVAGTKTFSSGQIYFEVKVEYKTQWSIGVAKTLVERKTYQTLKPENGYWVINLQSGHYKALNSDTPLILDLKTTPKQIGVFMDYEEGIVSFYDVDTAELIYSYTNCCFTGHLLPIFSPGQENSSYLILTPVTV